jgi:hypothetical protein
MGERKPAPFYADSGSTGKSRTAGPQVTQQAVKL